MGEIALTFFTRISYTYKHLRSCRDVVFDNLPVVMLSFEKGKPTATWGRKAMGPAETVSAMGGIAGLPNREQAGFFILH